MLENTNGVRWLAVVLALFGAAARADSLVTRNVTLSATDVRDPCP